MLSTTQASQRTAARQPVANHSRHLKNDDLELGAIHTDLEIWKQRFNVAFNMGLPPVDIVIERGNVAPSGTFRCEYAGGGWKREIAMQERSVFADWGTSCYCLTIGDLLHNLLHAYDDAHGTPCSDDDHNQSYQDHAAALGLVIDDAGVTHYSENSLFTRVLATYRVCTKALFCPEAALTRGNTLASF